MLDLTGKQSEHVGRSSFFQLLENLFQLFENNGQKLDGFIQNVAEILPQAWPSPKSAWARVVWKGRSFATANFRASRNRLAAAIHVDGQKVGMVEVGYNQDPPDLDERPFSREERQQIDMIAELLGCMASRVYAEQKLQVERRKQKNLNAALRLLTERVDEEKKSVGRVLLANIQTNLLPLLHNLDAAVPAKYRTQVSLLKRHLENLTDPLVDRLSRSLSNLTPAETRICSLVRDGMATKQIAAALHLSPATVNRHRENIRRKLGLTNASVNLTVYLQKVQQQCSASEPAIVLDQHHPPRRRFLNQVVKQSAN